MDDIHGDVRISQVRNGYIVNAVMNNYTDTHSRYVFESLGNLVTFLYEHFGLRLEK